MLRTGWINCTQIAPISLAQPAGPWSPLVEELTPSPGIWTEYCLVKLVFCNSTFFETHWVSPTDGHDFATPLVFCSRQLPALPVLEASTSTVSPGLTPFQKCHRGRNQLLAVYAACDVQDAAAWSSRSFWPLERIAKPAWWLGSLSFFRRSVGIPPLTVSKVTESFPKLFQWFYAYTPHVKTVAWLHSVLGTFLMSV